MTLAEQQAKHFHESWQIQARDEQNPSEGHYCAACGADVRWIGSDKSGPAPDGQWVTIPKPRRITVAEEDLRVLVAAGKCFTNPQTRQAVMHAEVALAEHTPKEKP